MTDDEKRAADTLCGFDPQGWQSIESAPKDGEDCLVCSLYEDGSAAITIAHWENEESHWREWGSPYPLDGASHWMRLPEPPST